MNVVFVSPGYPPFVFNYCCELRSAGARVLGIGDIPLEQLRPELRSAMDDYRHVPNLDAYETVRDAVADLTHAHGPIHRLESQNEYWLETDARLRDEFDIAGLRSSDMPRLRRKSGMKAVVRAHGIPHARGEALDDGGQLRAFVSNHGLPVVVKPDKGIGSVNTYLARTEAEIEQLVSTPIAGYVVEECLTGDIVSFDGLVGRTGELLFSTSLEYGSQVLGMRSVWGHWGHVLVRQMAPELEELGRRTVAAFDLRERFFHIEYFRGADGRYTFLEVNARLPGRVLDRHDQLCVRHQRLPPVGTTGRPG
jgi:hypothetical protein